MVYNSTVVSPKNRRLILNNQRSNPPIDDGSVELNRQLLEFTQVRSSHDTLALAANNTTAKAFESISSPVNAPGSQASE